MPSPFLLVALSKTKSSSTRQKPHHKISFHSQKKKKRKVSTPPTCTKKNSPLSTVPAWLEGEERPRSKNFSLQSLIKLFFFFPFAVKSYKSLFSFVSALSPKEQVKTFVFVFAHSFSFISQLLSMKFFIFFLLSKKFLSSKKVWRKFFPFSVLIYASQALDFGGKCFIGVDIFREGKEREKRLNFTFNHPVKWVWENSRNPQQLKHSSNF